MKICPYCSEQNPPRAAYCLACGSRLSTGQEARKTVTVLFCDVSGFTALGERLDAESLRHVMTRYFESVKSAIVSHGGTVEKFIGDAVMAVFGVPNVHEDDALRSIRAAEKARDKVAELNAELEAKWDVTLEVKVGVNSGEVMAGEAEDGRALVTGDVVNVAARLQQAAGPGEILLGDATRTLVKHAVVAEARSPLDVPGKQAPVTCWRLREVLADAPAVPRQMETPLVGREGEQDLVRNAFEHAVSSRSCSLVTILGPAGVGKSRLAAEVVARLGDAAQIVSGRCLPYGEGITYWPVKQLVEGACGITAGDSVGTARAKLAELLRGEQDEQLIAERVGQALSLVTARASAEEIFWGVRRLLEHVARRRPLIVVLDELQWAEPTLLDLIEHIAEWSRGVPMLLLCLAREDLLDVRPTWSGGQRNAISIRLDLLTEDETTRLMASVLGGRVFSHDLQSHVVTASGGNPLFVEQFLGMLIETGRIELRAGKWVPTGDLSVTPLPATIQALVSARLDDLGEERDLLKVAAVIGKEFEMTSLQSILEGTENETIEAMLGTLVQKDFCRPNPLQTDRASYVFKHGVIREVVYSTIPKQTRAQLHDRVADLTIETVGQRIDEYEEIVGYHLEQAHRYRAELGGDPDLPATARRAATYLAAAGHRAFSRDDGSSAIGLLTRATALLSTHDEMRSQLLPELGEALKEAGEFDRAASVLDEAAASAEAVGDPVLESRTQLVRLDLDFRTDPGKKTAEGRHELERLVEQLAAASDHAGTARAYNLLADLWWWRARFVEVEQASRRAIEHAHLANDRREEAWGVAGLAAAAAMGPRMVSEGIDLCSSILETSSGSRTIEARVLLPLALLNAWNRSFDDARDLLRRARSAHEDLGLRLRLETDVVQVQAVVEMLDDRPDEAERHLRRARTALAAMGGKANVPLLDVRLAQAVFAQGNVAEADELTSPYESSTSTDSAFLQVWWRTTRALVLARMGEIGPAEAFASEAVAVARDGDHLSMCADAHLALHEVLRSAGKTAEARSAALEAQDLYKTKGNLVGTATADRALAALQEPG